MEREPSEARRRNVILERMESKLKVVAEGHGGLVRGQEELREMIASLTTRVGFIENAMGDGFREVREIKAIVTRLDERSTLLGTRLDAHEQTHLR